MYDPGVNVSTDQAQPGRRAPAPGPGLRQLQDFVNTNDVEEGIDAVGTPGQLHEWLVTNGAIRREERVSPEAHARALAVREGLRALGLANNDEPLDEDLVAAMNLAAGTLRLLPTVRDSDTWGLAPAGTGVDGYLAGILSTLVTSIADGSWSRVKACRNDTCRWLFFDHSRNRSGTWCTMAVCGSRLKARAYRARRRENAQAS